ncbi:alpha-isopropylmalate/homocitrate synthase family transferase [Ignicoccus islandicus DSM 13165]|uniref:Citramalate synthase n=1 Tax=Ignicoccus islandicus DSM 13165 TaxID=940295 RepID=A0A0U3EAP1_9CREN|nr:citramalate synthase [Ignicoccus islandicus]ALU11507.1 alpha-isopropylmalate/homocitrate synthase family transferase [Ignicoccus islandicus DSM 13165]
MFTKFIDNKAPPEVEVLDTTLRDGAQAKDVSFDIQAKVRIALALDQIGVHFIEAGWPGSNPKDELFFKEIKRYTLENAEIVAFTSTRRKGLSASQDPILEKVLDADTKWVTVFGKSWDLHVTEVLNTTLEENLNMVYDTIKYLKENGRSVIFDAEHFFDGFKRNSEYAMEVLRTAIEAGADRIVLADTNGGMLPHEVYNVVRYVVEELPGVPIGVHMHNDSGCAVANTVMGVVAGASHVHVTVNGIGERTGNADLCAVVPNLELKLGVRALKNRDGLKMLKQLSKLVYDLAGLKPNPYQPYVGDNAFAHKAGVHVDAILKNPVAYEHVPPESVGNRRSLAISELSGAANLIGWAKRELGLHLDKRDPAVRRALKRIKELENEGYSFDNAVASALLILLEELGLRGKAFRMLDWRVISEGNEGGSKSWGMVKVGNGETYLEAEEGIGPVEAVEKALRKALKNVVPEVENVSLVDYRVHLPGVSKHTESDVRVEITFTDGKRLWTTTSVSRNIIEASLKALMEGIEYYVIRNKLEKIRGVLQANEEAPTL